MLRPCGVVVKGLEAPIFAHAALNNARLPGSRQVRQQEVVEASGHQGAVDDELFFLVAGTPGRRGETV